MSLSLKDQHLPMIHNINFRSYLLYSLVCHCVCEKHFNLKLSLRVCRPRLLKHGCSDSWRWCAGKCWRELSESIASSSCCHEYIRPLHASESAVWRHRSSRCPVISYPLAVNKFCVCMQFTEPCWADRKGVVWRYVTRLS